MVTIQYTVASVGISTHKSNNEQTSSHIYDVSTYCLDHLVMTLFLIYRSIYGLKNLSRLDLGNNEIEELVCLAKDMQSIRMPYFFAIAA